MLGIPAVGVFDSTVAEGAIVENGELHILPDGRASIYDYVVHGRPATAGRPPQLPIEHYQEKAFIHDPASGMRTGASFYEPPKTIEKVKPGMFEWFTKMHGAGKATVIVSTVAAVGTIGYFALKYLGERQDHDKRAAIS